MINRPEIIKELLENYQSGNATSSNPPEYDINQTELMEIVETMERGNLITYASII